MFEWVVAAGILGVLAVYLVPFVSKYVTQYIPSTLTSNVFVQVLIIGAILAVGLYAVKKAGLGRFTEHVA